MTGLNQSTISISGAPLDSETLVILCPLTFPGTRKKQKE